MMLGVIVKIDPAKQKPFNAYHLHGSEIGSFGISEKRRSALTLFTIERLMLDGGAKLAKQRREGH